MKRYGGLWERIMSAENIEASVTAALKNQRHNAQYRDFIANREKYTEEIRQRLTDGTFQFSPLYEFRVYEPKERIIHCPRLYDKVVHHAIMDVCKPYIVSKMTSDTYGSIKGRGLQKCAAAIRRNRNRFAEWYFVQIDCKKFYQSIPHDKLKQSVRRVFKDKMVLHYLDMIIDRHDEGGGKGLAIGVFPSQYLSNLYLSAVDHYVKEVLHLKFYYRYMDDIVCFVPTKADAHNVLARLTERIEQLGLSVKANARISPFRCGVDFIGYVFYPTHTKLRKRIKNNMKRKAKRFSNADDKTWGIQMASYYGWIKYGNCKNLWKRLKDNRMIEYRKLSKIRNYDTWFDVPKENRVSVRELCDSARSIIFIDYILQEIKGVEKAIVKFIYEDENCDNPTFHVFITNSGVIKDRLKNDKESGYMPFAAVVKKKKGYLCYE